MAKIAVIGLGRFGMSLARLLSRAGAEVLAIDRNGGLVAEASEDVAVAVRLDCTDEEALRMQGVDKVDVAVVGIGSHFEATVLTTSILRTLGVPRVVARAGSADRARILSRVGAHDVVFPEIETAQRWAHRLMTPHLRNFIELGEGHSLVEIAAPAAFVGRTPAQLTLRNRYDVNLVAIKRPASPKAEGAQPTPLEMLMPRPDTRILAGDWLVLFGPTEAIAKLPAD